MRKPARPPDGSRSIGKGPHLTRRPTDKNGPKQVGLRHPIEQNPILVEPTEAWPNTGPDPVKTCPNSDDSNQHDAEPAPPLSKPTRNLAERKLFVATPA